MPPHLVVIPGQFIEIEVHDPDGHGDAILIGTLEKVSKFAGGQAYRLVVVGRARPLTEEDQS